MKHTRLRCACYAMNVTMSVVGNLPPILFLTFRSFYGLSYSMLGLLVLVNFSTQLAVDLIFSFFSHRFNMSKTIKLMPWLSVIGFAIYSAAPLLLPNAVFFGLLLGTAIFSASSGLAEVLLSPVIAALPSDDPERAMSGLHSAYAWGVVVVIILATAFLAVFGAERWQVLVMVASAIPVTSALLFAKAEIPKLETPGCVTGAVRMLRQPWLWVCVAAIFLGGAAEVTMSQWASSYLEKSFGVTKALGDVFGVALFAAMLGLGRTLYSKIGRHIERVLLFGAIGATVCYIAAGLTVSPVIGLIACAFTGFCVSMMWPGSLVVAAERFPDGGVFIYAMMAAGGDLGASVAPQLVGVVADFALKNEAVIAAAANVGMNAEQLGMKLGLLVGAVFPALAVIVYFTLLKKREERCSDKYTVVNK
ncbi:MAG: MFS transporter [Oscillospiraceae bacterium]|nr:MFS transporter [Oscillospiraceae bacterium]